MHLFLNDTSPFARLVLITAIEAKANNMNLVWTDPWASPEELLVMNPFSTVPTLHLEDGSALYESLMICEFLMAQSNPKHASLVPHEYGNQAALQQLARGKTLMETAFRKVVLERFAPDTQNNVLLERTGTAIARTLCGLDAILDTPRGEQANFPDLCLAVALEYIRFRLNDLFSEKVGPKTLDWLNTWQTHPSFKHTTPEQLKHRPSNISSLLGESN